MATYSYTDPLTNFVYSYTDTEPTIKDQIRGLIGDVVGTPVWYLSDNSITATATQQGNDLFESAAVCCEKCAGRCLSLHREVQQGHRLRIVNFDPDKAYDSFMKMATMLRNKSQLPGFLNPAAVSGTMGGCPPVTTPGTYQEKINPNYPFVNNADFDPELGPSGGGQLY